MLLALMAIIGLLANPNMVAVKAGGVEWLPINLYINGDTFYYVMYGVLGRAIGMMNSDKKWLTALSAGLFIAGVWVISRGTLHELRWRATAIPGIYIAVPQFCLRDSASSWKKYAEYA